MVEVRVPVTEMRLVAAHAHAAVAVDADRLVALDVRRLIALGLDVKLFAALFVLEANLVEVAGAAALGAARLDPALGLVVGQRVGRHVVRVVDAPGDDRSVRIPLQELDDHLLPDAGDVHRAPPRPRPDLRHPHPARAVLVALPLAIPVELHLHTPVLVGRDLLARFADHDGGLGAIDAGDGRRHRRSKRIDRVHDRERRAEITGVVIRPGIVRVVQCLEGRGDDQVLLILIVVGKVREREQITGAQALHVTRRGPDLGIIQLRRQPVSHVGVDVGLLRIPRREVEHLEAGLLEDVRTLRAGAQVGARPLEVEVAAGHRVWAPLQCKLPSVQRLSGGRRR